MRTSLLETVLYHHLLYTKYRFIFKAFEYRGISCLLSFWDLSTPLRMPLLRSSPRSRAIIRHKHAKSRHVYVAHGGPVQNGRAKLESLPGAQRIMMEAYKASYYFPCFDFRGKPVRIPLLWSSPCYRTIIRHKQFALAAESVQIKACLCGSERTSLLEILWCFYLLRTEH